MAADGKVRDEGDEGSPEAEAAEYVLGTLDPRERRAAEWRLRRDLAFASAVARWSEQLAVLVLGGDDLDLVAQLLTEDLEGRLVERLGRGRHLAQVEEHGDQ